MKQVGDPCPYCQVPISKQTIARKRKSAADNARASVAKAKANGTKLGRPKIRDDREIKRLGRIGFSIRQIAHRTGVSIATVQRGLK